jgi:IS30 family transposase
MKQYQHLSNEERLYIQHGLRSGKTQKQIGVELDRSPSTISRKIRRNMFPQCYLYTHHWACWGVRWRKRSQYQTLSKTNRKIQGDIKIKVIALLKRYLSPEQVSLYLQQHNDIDISYECIYRYIYSNKKRKIELKPYLRQGKRRYRKRYGSSSRSSLIPNRRSISERPKIVDAKNELVIGSVTRSSVKIEKVL